MFFFFHSHAFRTQFAMALGRTNFYSTLLILAIMARQDVVALSQVSLLLYPLATIYYSSNYSFLKRSKNLTTPENLMVFRKMEHKLLNASYIESLTFAWRPLAPNTISLNLTANKLKVVINRCDIHIVLYRRYARWQRFLINIWEDFCDILNPNISTPMCDIIYRNIRPYTNVRHPCPYNINESLYVVAKRLDMKDIKLPLFPAAEYRFDFTFTYDQIRSPVFFLQFYFDISDHRVFQY